MADSFLAELLRGEADVALVAVGGHGRRELSPGSDLDLVLLHAGRADVAAVADRVWYPVWDSGVPLDHSVRTVGQTVDVAQSDLKAMLGLLSARHVAGDPALTAELVRRVRDLWRRRAPSALPELRDAIEERHARVGDIAFLLEPDLKEGRGGLRDFVSLHAIAVAQVADVPAPRIRSAYDVLLTARAELHRCTGRRTDVLVMQEQEAVATATGAPDAVALMSRVSASGRAIGFATDQTLRRVDGWVASRRRRLTRPLRAQPVAPGLAQHGGEVVLAAGANALADPGVPLRAAAASAALGVPLSAATLERLAAEAPAPPEPWPPAMRTALVDLLATGRGGVGALEALDQYGLLERLVPEWAAVRSRSQRNPYHRYTVDRHLCEAAAHAATLTRQVARPDLLLVAAWLHDIGKGGAGDHTAAGVVLIERIATRMGFDPADVRVLADLVRHHLLLADTATRRDVTDPRIAASVAASLGSRDRLDLLAALTEADAVATGPTAWSDWKSGLVRELVGHVRAQLDGRPAASPPDVVARHTEAVDEGETVVRLAADATQLVVITPDRPGLLWRVAGALALHRLDVRDALLGSRDGIAVQEMRLEPADGSTPDVARVVDDVRRAVAGRLAVEARLAERAHAYRRRTPVVAAPPVVTLDDAAETATVVEVRASDEVGVLYRVARALADCCLDVRSAKVSTLGHEVIDSFYVVDAAGQPMTDPGHRAEVVRAILAALEPSGAGSQ